MKGFARFAWFYAIDHVMVVLMVLLLTTSLLEFSFSVSFLNPLARSLSNFSMTDIFYDISKSKAQKDQDNLITLVDMSEVYERGDLADIIEQIENLKPQVLGVDIVFDGVRNDSVGNKRLIEVAQNSKVPTVWACKLMEWNDEAEQFCYTNHSFLTDSCLVDEGFTNVERDVNGGTVRHFGVRRKSEGRRVYSLPARVARLYTGGDPAMDNDMSCAINFHAVKFPVVPYDSIAEHADLIRGHIVLLGAAQEERDKHYTPLGLIPGLYVLAYTVKTMVEHQAPITLSVWVIWALSLLVTLFTQVAQAYAFDITVRHRLGSVKCLGRMGVTSSVIFFTLVTVLVGASFMLYIRDNINLDVKWAILCMALLGTARLIYSVIVNLIGDYAYPHFLRDVADKSLYRYESEAKTVGKIEMQQSTIEL